jgi:hypothetical protein
MGSNVLRQKRQTLLLAMSTAQADGIPRNRMSGILHIRICGGDVWVTNVSTRNKT